LSQLIWYEVTDENIVHVSCFIDFISQFAQATRPRPQKSADFIVHLTSSLVPHLLPSIEISPVTGLLGSEMNSLGFGDLKVYM